MDFDIHSLDEGSSSVDMNDTEDGLSLSSSSSEGTYPLAPLPFVLSSLSYFLSFFLSFLSFFLSFFLFFFHLHLDLHLDQDQDQEQNQDQAKDQDQVVFDACPICHPFARKRIRHRGPHIYRASHVGRYKCNYCSFTNFSKYAFFLFLYWIV